MCKRAISFCSICPTKREISFSMLKWSVGGDMFVVFEWSDIHLLVPECRNFISAFTVRPDGTETILAKSDEKLVETKQKTKHLNLCFCFSIVLQKGVAPKLWHNVAKLSRSCSVATLFYQPFESSLWRCIDSFLVSHKSQLWTFDVQLCFGLSMRFGIL